MIVFIDNIRFKIAHKIADVLAKTKVAPHHITIFRFVVATPLCLYFFSRGEYLYNVIGLAIYVSLAILDWVDGRLARITNQLSVMGKWLDEVSDQILMVVVLTSILYPGLSSTDSSLWFKTAIIFYSLLFLSTVITADFNQMFGLDFNRYQEVEKKAIQSSKHLRISDHFLINTLNVHRNSISKFCFCISYPLFLGIVTNKLLITFIFITSMMAIRILVFLSIMYRSAKKGRTNSALIRVFREYVKSDF